ncbi:hypothetical protein GCU67_08105 [Modestobacter muralis]|uniref:Peripheral subunit-binding (PSBD) domain-containing protein n=1 Tax=Modestobacter muralis TaxID=1608614 RepID=A0A6P0HA50_9ACTN|nr:E3 binding domain-containing protein [Modestobacter muralis]NEK94137.1 hypothetical protein [Modestobacter muralis]NEN50904.1 hypothetical protein [Modestobacter muralis]
MTRPKQVTAEAARLAASLGVDTSRVYGLGPNREVTAEDVRRVAAYRDPIGRHLAALPAPDARSLTTGGRVAADPAVASFNSRVAVADPAVRQLANARGVRLDRLTGTGSNGVVQQSDVLTAAAAQDRQHAAAWAAVAPAAPAPEPRVSFTASGLPVSVLDEVPAPVRRALAAAPDHATAFALVQKYGALAAADAERLLRADRSVLTTYGGAKLPAGVWPDA